MILMSSSEITKLRLQIDLPAAPAGRALGRGVVEAIARKSGMTMSG